MNDQQTSNWLATTLLAVALFAIFAGERVLGEGSLRNLCSGAGGLLMLAAIGVRVQALLRATADVRAVEVRLLVAYLGVLLGLLLYALSTDVAMDALGLAEESRSRAVAVLSVLWMAVLLVSLTALLFMELVYARMPIAASVELRRVRTAAYAGLTLALSAVFLLSVNYVVTARDVRRDVSYFKTTEPSESTRRMLSKLKTPVKAMLFYRRTDDVLAQLQPYFQSLSKLNPKFTYDIVDAALMPDLARKQRVSGNGSVLLLIGTPDAVQKAQLIKIGLELTEARPQLRKLDSLFQQNFAKLTTAERSVWLTVGHGERNSKADENPTERGEGTKVLDEVWKRLNLKANRLGVSQGLANAVPDGSGAVIVLGAREPFLAEEVQSLLGYVRKGGRLMLMLDPNVDDGLDPLLEGLGLKRLPGVLGATKNYMRRKYDASDHGIVYSNKYSSHPSVTTASRYQAEVATVMVNGAGLDKAGTNVEPKPSVTFALRSSGDFFRDLNGNFERDANEPEETANLVAAVTVREKPDAPEGRAIVIGDGEFMADKLATNNGNIMVFVDGLAWLIGNEELNAEVSSEEDIPIEHSRDKDKLWFYATTFAFPLPLLGLGVWVARRRRRSGEASA
jgi:hypothetical protein